MTDTNYDIHPAARALIPDHLRGLVGRYGFTRSDADDLWQELALQAHVAGARFDPSKSGGFRYFDRVLANKVRSIIAGALCQKRDRRREQSLNGGDPAVARGRTVEQADLAIDVRDALAPLSPADREVAWLLAADCVTGVARYTNTTRSVIRGAKARIARALVEKDLAPISSAAQPIRARTRYVFDDGTDHHLNSQLSGREAEAVGVRSPGRGERAALPAAEGAP